MIHSNEKLLPGNVVMYNHEDGDRPIKLTSYVVFEIATDKVNQRSFSPIPLTPEVLVGYKIAEWSIYHQGWHCGNFVLRENHDGGFRVYFVKDRINAIHENVAHLHTLQNLIYFLSGEELVVTIPKQ